LFDFLDESPLGEYLQEIVAQKFIFHARTEENGKSPEQLSIILPTQRPGLSFCH